MMEEEEGVVAEKVMRKKLALVVKSIQWSYSIFWSLSSTQPGVLEWGDGYYNGDIKTRKTVQSVEISTGEFGSQRTEQLRQLYESLSAAETNPQAKRPSAASLSPEDLTDTEWYFLVCMSFHFNIGQGLPGRTFSNNQTIWLCNAHYADSKVFSRSLLAKSASIQTVVCFPYLGGVVELGVTEPVLEDPNIIQNIKASFLEIPSPIASNISKYDSKTAINEAIELDQDFDIIDTDIVDVVQCEEVNNTCSPNKRLSKFEPVQRPEELLMVEGVNGGVSQVQSWQFMDDEQISNCIQISTNSSDSISQTLASTEKVVSHSNGEKVNDDCDTKLMSYDFVKDDRHYKRVLSILLKTSDNLILGPSFRNGNRESSFVSWKKGELLSGSDTSQGGGSQRLLKKVLCEVARMHGGCLLEPREENGMREKLWRPEVDEIDTNHVLSERKRRERINERFLILGELVPSTSKVDKVSVLDNTIEYLKELGRRVEELESCKEVLEVEETETKRKPRDVVERTSDNYGDNKMINKNKKTTTNKRKACDTEGMEAENDRILTKGASTNDVTVSKIEKNVLVEMKCHWRDNLLLEIMDAMSNLSLDSHSVQSSNVDGILSLTIKAQLKGSTKVSIGTIRHALHKVVYKC